MQSRYRTYGTGPLTVVVVHGGLGGAGEVAPLAQELGRRGYGVLEPFQCEASVGGQVEELREAIENLARPPVALIGWSWGAWLSWLLAARHPSLVSKLILVGSGPFEAADAATIAPTRMSRLTEAERAEYSALSADLDDPVRLGRFMHLLEKADSYAPDSEPRPEIVFDRKIHEAVWAEAAAMRRSGELLRAASAIRCPVVALHGNHDPHPAEGVERPLRTALPGFDFVLLRKCGHKPWIEIHARAAFFDALGKAIGPAGAAIGAAAS